MIEPDINERMARFAPSQNIRPEPDPIALEVIAETEPDVPPMVQSIDPIAFQIARESQEEMMATLRGASAVNPDQAARAQRIGQQIGIGQDVVLRNMPEMEREAVARQVIDRDMLRHTPNLARFLGQREFATVAHDDIDNLTKVEKLFRWVGGIPKDVEEGLSRAVATSELGRMYYNQMQGVEPTWLDKVVIKSYNDELGRLSRESGFIESAANIVGIQAEMLAEVPEQVALGATMGGTWGLVGGPLAPATVPAGMAAGATVGLGVGFARAAYILEAGNAYGGIVEQADAELSRRRDEGLIDAKTYGDEMQKVRGSARNIATGVGLVNAGLEMVGLKLVAAPFQQAFKGAVRRATATALTQQTTRAALGRAGLQYGRAVAGETGTEEIQEIVTVAGEELAMYGNDLPMKMSTEEGRAEIAKRLVDTAIETAQGMTLVGLPGPAANFYVNTAKAAEAQKTQRFITDLADLSQKDKLAERSGPAFERFIAAQAEGTKAETIYVDAQTMQSMLAQAQRADPNLTNEVIDEAMPGVREQIARQVDIGGDVTIPTSQFAARLARTDFGRSLIPHVRLSPDAMSVTEAQQFMGRRADEVKEARALLEAKNATETNFVQEADEIRTAMKDQLVAAGRDDLTADAESTIYQAMIVTAAAREGMTPRQYQEQFGRLDVVGVGAPAAAMEQADQFDQVALETIAQLTNDELRQLLDYAYEVDAIQGDIDTLETELDRREVEEDDPSGGDDEPSRSTTGFGIEELMRQRARQARQDNLTPEQLGASIRRDGDFAVLAQAEPLATVTDEELGLEAYAALQAHEQRISNMRKRFVAESRTTANIMEQAAGPQVFEQRPITPGFYSALERELTAIDAKAMAASGWKERINGLVGKGAIKAEELEWTGLLDWIDMQEGKVSKDTVLEFVRSNGVRVERVDPTTREYEKLVLPGGTNYREVLLALPLRPSPELPGRVEALPNGKFLVVYPRLPDAMFATQEAADADLANKQTQEDPNVYRTRHWDQPNVLVHLRMNDRVDADGKRVLFVEEVQSDWGQAGRKKGFAKPLLATLPEGTLFYNKGEFQEVPNAAVVQLPQRLGGRSLFYGETIEEATQQALSHTKPGTVARAPFVETTDGWLNLGLKQIMLEAVNGGYDRVAFVNGKQSADRYDLSKQVDYIDYRNAGQDKYDVGVVAKDDQQVFLETGITQDRIEEVLGKEIADKIARGEGEPGGGRRTLRGLDLKVGGKGMKEFYDSIVPIAMNKLLKKYGGGKVGTVDIDMRTPESEAYYAEPTDADILPQPGFAVTPEMLKKMESGLPLFQAARGEARGGFDPGRMRLFLTKQQDSSTVIHELTHFALQSMTDLAATGRASPQVLADLDLLFQWRKDAIAGDTPEARLATWLAMSIDQQRTALQEPLAYNGEIYFFEGKAPSAELRGVFDRLRSFMLRVYKSIRDEINAIYRREFGEDLPMLTPEVRGVFDRMLASEEQIRRQTAINEMKPTFQTQAESGMDDATWAAYKAMEQEAIEASVTDMTKASLRQMQWLGGARSRVLRDLQKKHDAARKEVAQEVSAAVRVEPVYRAMTYLRYGKFIDADGQEIEVEGPHRLSLEGVKAIYANLPSEESAKLLRAGGTVVAAVRPQFERLGYGRYGMLAEEGGNPDMVAELFGFSSGDEMIRALLAAKPVKEEVAARTDAEMMRRYGDMNTPAAQEAAVQEALHNEARGRFVAVEYRFLSRATQPVRVMLEAARQVAQELLADKRIRDIRPSEFVAAEARAARDAARIIREADPVAAGLATETRALNERLEAGMDNATAMAEAMVEGAEATRKAQERSDALRAQYGADPQQALIRVKRAQMYQNQLAAESLKVKAEVDKGVKYVRKVLRDTNVKAMGADAADQIGQLLERFEVAAVSLKRLDERKSLAQWMDSMEASGLVPDIAPELVAETARVNYREMTVAQFRDLVDAVKQIEHVGKREKNAAQEQLRAKFNDLKDEVNQNMRDVAAKRGRKARKELGDEDRKWSQLIAGYDAMQQTIGSIVYVLDGGKRDGPLARMLLFTANNAGNQETTDRANATLALSKILEPIERKGEFGARKVYFKQIDDSLSLVQRMVIALNYGNQSNIDRLLKGENWTEDQVGPILESLTEEQLKAVQAIWDYVASFKPRVAAQQRNLLGREPNWIEPRPFTVRSVDGKIVNMAGGYYPVKYNPRRSSMSRQVDESVEAERQLREAITGATTTQSYTKNRSVRPPEGAVLSRELSGLYAGVNEVIHDLAWRTWAMDANRLLRDREFQTIINSIYGRETYSAIKNWVDATVRGERGNYDVIENIAIGVRRNVSISAMALKFITGAIQVTGLIPATTRTGITPMIRSVAYFLANPRESSRIAREKSSFMRNRGRTRYRDLNEIANIVRGESRARRAYLANAYALIGLMQGMVDMSVWWASYSNAIKEGKAEDMAVAIADQTVIDTQGSGMLKDLSEAMRGGKKQSAYAKLFTSFYQFSNTQYALLSSQVRTAPTTGKAAADIFTILVAGALIEEILRMLLKPSTDDQEPEDIAKALIANQIDFVIGLPFGGGELRGLGNIVVGEQAMQYRGPSGLRMVGEVRTFATQAIQGEFDRAWLRSTINMSGLIWGIPSAQINDTIDGINAVIEGDVEGPEAVLAPFTGVKR